MTNDTAHSLLCPLPIDMSDIFQLGCACHLYVVTRLHNQVRSESRKLSPRFLNPQPVPIANCPKAVDFDVRSESFIVILSHNEHPRWHSSANTLWRVSPSKIKPLEMADNGELYILPIVFLRHTQCNKDQLYLILQIWTYWRTSKRWYRRLADILT